MVPSWVSFINFGKSVWSNKLLELFFFCFRVAADALRILLARAQLDEVTKRLDEDKAWDAMKEPNTHITGVTLLARYTHCIDRHCIEGICQELNIKKQMKLKHHPKAFRTINILYDKQ